MTDYEALLQVISRTTRYMRTYLAKVIDNKDNDGRGRVLIIIPELGIITESEGVWADVEQPVSHNVIPAIDDWVSVYFMSGDASKPTVRGIVNSIKDNVPETDEQNRLLYKDEVLKVNLDIENKELTIETDGKINISITGDTEISVDGEVKLTSSKTTINGHLEIS